MSCVEWMSEGFLGWFVHLFHADAQTTGCAAPTFPTDSTANGFGVNLSVSVQAVQD